MIRIMPPSSDLSFLRDRAVLKRIALVTFGCAVLGALFGTFAPKWYRSVLTVVPAKQQSAGGGLASLLGGSMGGLAAGLESSLGGAAEGPRISAVLQSIAVTDAVIQKFDLQTRYGKRYLETTRDELWRHCSAKVLSKPNLVQLTCEDKDPRFVQEMLAYFAEYGNQVFRKVSVSSASEEARFLDRRVAELRQQAADTAERMRAFQEKHQIIDLETQAKAVVSALAALNNQRISKELELGYTRSFTSGEEATTQQLRSQLGLLDDKLRDLGGESPAPGAKPEDPGRQRKGGRGVFPAALAVPKLRAEYEGLYRDRRVSEAMLVIALERLENARASEARDVSTFLVLDPPALPTRHSWPKRLLSTVIGMILGLLAGFGVEWIRAQGGMGSVASRYLGSRPATTSDRRA